MPQRLRSPLLILVLGLFYFYDLVLHPTAVLYSDHSDLIAAHIPDKTFLVRSFQETGELPLWCPYRFAGSPFIHDIQLAAFYPPHYMLYLVPPESVGTALSWLIVSHVILAGWLMYAYAGTQGLSEPARLVAAVGYMFAGRWLLHLLGGGHYVVIGMAWLPLLLQLYETALRKRSLPTVVVAGCVLALMILGTQPQWTFYSGLFVGPWALRTAWEASVNHVPAATLRRQLLHAAGLWLGAGTWIISVGVCLAVVQLFPTLEAAGLSTRGGGVEKTEVLGGGLRTLLFLVGPALSADPPNLAWEDRGGLSLLWLTAAVIAGTSLKGRVRFLGLITLGLAAFAVGGAYLVQGLPGFQLFRSPNRMFVVLGFPVALLAGHATDALFAANAGDLFRRSRAVLLRVLIAVAILAGGFSLRMVWQGDVPRFHVYWLSLLVTVPVLLALLNRSHPWLVRNGVVLWMLLLLVDSWALTLPLVETRPQADLFPPSASVDRLAALCPPGTGRVLDRDGLFNPGCSPLGFGSPMTELRQIEGLRGYTPLDNRRYKEYLQFIAGKDERLTAFSNPLAFPVINDFPIVHKRLLDLLGVRYLLTPGATPAAAAALGGPAVVGSFPAERDGWEWAFDDPNPVVYDMDRGGVRSLPPYSVYRNQTALPRAFVVYSAAPLSEPKDVLAQLSTTDFRQVVLLENADGLALNQDPGAGPRAATVTRYEPNRVTVEVGDGPSGWLVLADPWYPGWVARFDGAAETQPLYRADYLFRAVRVPEGSHSVEFRFEPRSYHIGCVYSLTMVVLSLALLGCWGFNAIFRRRARR